MQTAPWLQLELAGLGAVAGVLGALVGIGGGVLVVPALVLLFGVDIRVAVATSLIAVVASSTAAGSVYVGEGTANMPLGMTLEIATTLGGLTGGLIAVIISTRALAVIFGVMMGVTAALLARRGEQPSAAGRPGGVVAHRDPGWLDGTYTDERGVEVTYGVERVPVGMAVSFAAGVASGMLGVGGGFLKVPGMVLGMRVPFRPAAATSNFMIGVTAASSLFVYFARGYVHPTLAAPIAIGVAGGALAGTLLTPRIHSTTLRRILALILVIVGLEMLLEAFGVGLER